MIQVNKITLAQMESKAAELGLALPIEQTSVWATYQTTIPGRAPWARMAAARPAISGKASLPRSHGPFLG